MTFYQLLLTTTIRSGMETRNENLYFDIGDVRVAPSTSDSGQNKTQKTSLI